MKCIEPTITIVNEDINVVDKSSVICETIDELKSTFEDIIQSFRGVLNTE